MNEVCGKPGFFVAFALGLLSAGKLPGQTNAPPLISTSGVPRQMRQEPQSVPVVSPTGVYTLPRLIDIAEHNNPQSRIAWEQSKQAAEQVGIARSELFPVLSFEVLALKGDLLFGLPPNLSSEGVIKINSVIYQPAVKLAWTIFDFGGNRATYNQAKYLALSQKMALNETNDKVAAAVYKAYSNLVSAKSHLASVLAANRTSRSIEDSVETRFQAGLASAVDLAEARAQEKVSIASLVKAEGAMMNARIDLATSAGMHDGDAIDIPGIEQAPKPEVIAGSARDFVQQALANRPDLIAAADQLKASQYAVKQARSMLYPKITVDAVDQYTATMNTPSTGGAAGASAQSATMNVDGDTYVVAGHLTWNLFDAGARRDRLRQAQSQGREAGDRLEGMRLEAEKQVWNAYNAVVSAVEDEDAAKSMLDAAQESFNATHEGYDQGTKQLLDLEQAQQKLTAADSAYQISRAQTLETAAQLSFTTGDLLQTGPKLPTPTQGMR